METEIAQATPKLKAKVEAPLNLAEQIVEWDPDNKRQIEDSKKIYQQARREGREIRDLEDNIVEFFHPDMEGFKILGKALKDGEFSFRILNEKGDETIVWDSRNPDQIAEAAKTFKDYIAKGWTAYAVSADGTMKRKVTHFNHELLEVTFEEPGKEGTSWKDKLSNFVKGFSQVQLQPATYKG